MRKDANGSKCGDSLILELGFTGMFTSFMASESSDVSEQLWTPLPSLPRIPVASSSRARLAHRRPTSISLPSKLAQSSSSQSGGEKSDTSKPSQGQLPSTDSFESYSAPALVPSLDSLVAGRLGAAGFDSRLAPICEQASSSAACSSTLLSLLNAGNASLSSVSDNSFRSTRSPVSGLSPCTRAVAAKPCEHSTDVSHINPRLPSLQALPHSSESVVHPDSQRERDNDAEEIKLFSLADDSGTKTSCRNPEPKLLVTGGAAFYENKFSEAQSPMLQVRSAELEKNLGLDSEESEPEEGQLSGEWSGSEDSVEERDQIFDEKLEDCSTPSPVSEVGFTVTQTAKLSWIHFSLGNKSSLPSCSTSVPAGRQIRKSETAEKKRKKHKKGEGAKKRAREKSAQKYKEKKKQRLNADAVEQPGDSPVSRLAKGEQHESQTVRRNSVEDVNHEPKSGRKIHSSKDAVEEGNKDVIEEGEISQPTQTSTGLLSSLVEAEVGLWTTDDIDDHLVAQMEDDVAVKKKRGPQTAERMLKRKIAKRKKRAKKERESGVRKRLPRNTVTKPPIKVLCTHFMKGRCLKGEKCPFSHDAIPLTKQEPCKFLMSHSCLKGDDCPFSHDLKAFPCKFFHTRGLCYDGNKCLFSHGPITEEEREKLLKRVEKDKERGNIASAFDLATPEFSSSLPAEEDPDPLGWGTASACPSFDVDLQQRSPEATLEYNVGADYGDLPETSYRERSNWEITPSTTVEVTEGEQLHSASHHSNNQSTSDELDHVDIQCKTVHHTTGSATNPDAVEVNVPPSTADISAVFAAAPILAPQRGSLFVKRMLKPEKSGPTLTQTKGSRKLTVESLLGEVLKH